MRERSAPMTLEQICERYPDQWVALVEVEREDKRNWRFRTARVIGHGARHEPCEVSDEWRSIYPSINHLYTGQRNPLDPLLYVCRDDGDAL